MAVGCVGGAISPVCAFVLPLFHDSRLHVLAEPRETRPLCQSKHRQGRREIPSTSTRSLLLRIKARLLPIPTFCLFCFFFLQQMYETDMWGLTRNLFAPKHSRKRLDTFQKCVDIGCAYL